MLMRTGSGPVIVELLEEIGRFRALTDAESRLLERVLQANQIRQGRRFWTHTEDALLKRLVAKGFTAITIAERMERTPDAVRTRIKVIRKPKKAQVRVRGRVR